MTTYKVQLATVHGIVAGATGKTPIHNGVAILDAESRSRAYDEEAV